MLEFYLENQAKLRQLRQYPVGNILPTTGDIRKVALWLGHESMQTTEDYLRVDETQRTGVLHTVTPPQLRPGKFRPPDKLIASLRG